MKLPALQFYPGDWRKDPGVQALNYEERGIWIEILFLMHESEQRGKLLLNGKPIADDRLAQLLHLDKQKISTVISTLVELGVAKIDHDTGALMNRRMVRDQEIIEIRRAAGKKGGNPAFLKGKGNPYYNQKDKQKDKQTGKQKITPSSSSSSSSSNNKDISSHREKARDELFDAVVEICKVDLGLCTDEQRGALNQTVGRMRKANKTPAEVRAVGKWWFGHDWRGKQGQAPEPHQLREVWKRALEKNTPRDVLAGAVSFEELQRRAM